MGLIEVLAIVFGLAGYVEGIRKANESGYTWECSGYKNYRSYPLRKRILPWPFRRNGIEPLPGAINTCTGETYNGKWWYKP